MKGHLRYDAMGASMLHDCYTRPPVKMKELGISYTHSTPQSMCDQWWFWNCEWEGELPPFIERMNMDPMECMGWGLSEEQAKEISAQETR